MLIFVIWHLIFFVKASKIHFDVHWNNVHQNDKEKSNCLGSCYSCNWVQQNKITYGNK